MLPETASQDRPEEPSLIEGRTLDDISNTLEAIAEAHDKINRSRLTERAIILLLSDIAKLNRGIVRDVWRAIPKLREFVKPNDFGADQMEQAVQPSGSEPTHHG